jgi:hypothetical protein
MECISRQSSPFVILYFTLSCHCSLLKARPALIGRWAVVRCRRKDELGG